MWTAALALLPSIVLATAAAAVENPPAAKVPVVKEWKVEWGGRPRDPYVAPDGKVWFVGQAGNYVALRSGTESSAATRSRTTPIRTTVIVDETASPGTRATATGASASSTRRPAT